MPVTLTNNAVTSILTRHSNQCSVRHAFAIYNSLFPIFIVKDRSDPLPVLRGCRHIKCVSTIAHYTNHSQEFLGNKWTCPRGLRPSICGNADD